MAKDKNKDKNKNKKGSRVIPEVNSKAGSQANIMPNDSAVISAVETTQENILQQAPANPPALWFNELVEVIEPQEKKLNPRRRRPRKEEEKPSEVSNDNSNVPF